MILQRLNNDERNFEFIDPNDKRDKIFGELNNYIKYIFEFLWKHPYYVAEILSLSDINDVKNYLAHFFTVNFYENNLSNNKKEGQLLYIITLLLKEELNNMNINDSNNIINNIEKEFLNNSPCSYIFEQLFYKNEIQSFFKTIVIDIIDELEISYPSQEIVFNPSLIRDSILLEQKERYEAKKKGKEVIKKDENVVIFGKLDSKKDKNINEKLKLFNQKYQFGLQREELIKISKEYKDQNMINYINKKILECSDNYYIYSTSIFLENVNFTTMSDKIGEKYNDEQRKEFSKNILTIYQQSFFETIKIIDKLFDNLISNMHLLPYLIKCINKIIFTFIDKKFADLPVFEKNIFISQFFFNKLFFPILLNPSIYVLINDFIISENTIYNLSTIMSIINKFVTGQFYEDTKIEGQYTPLNWYFLNKMPKLLEFFEKSSNVILPDFIEKLINNENDVDFEFDYFEENKEEMILARNILYSFHDFYYLYMNMEKNKDILFDDKNEKTKIIKKAITRLRESEYRIDKIKNIFEQPDGEQGNSSANNYKKSKTFDKNESNNIKNPNLKFFLMSDLIFNKKCEIFNIKKDKEYYNIKDLKNKNTNDKIVIKAKNSICAFLYNYYSFEDINLNLKKEENKNSFYIFKKLKNYTKSSDLLSNEKIPFEWYIDSIIEYFKKLPEKYVENDYSLLYEELENEIKNSIKLYNFEEISILANKIKFLKHSHIFYEESKKILIDIDLNKRVQVILEKENIPMEIKFAYSGKNNKNKFKITPISSSITGYFSPLKLFSYSEKKTCQTINQFISVFPDLTELTKYQDIHVFDIIKELEIPKKLEEYFDYIEEHLKVSEIEKGNEIKDIKIKIYDYVMEKLYDKLFPDEPGDDDIIIYSNCLKVSWVELKHFIKGKDDYILENFIPDTNIYFQQINKEKSPRKKLIYMNKIFTCIDNLGLLNGDKLEGTDEILSILNFAFIKNKPLSIYSNCKYMKLFIGDKKNKGEGHQLSQLIGICQQMLNFNHTCLFDVSKEEYEKNCLMIINDEINEEMNEINKI